MAHPAKAKTHGHFARHGAHGPAGNGKQADRFYLSGVIEVILQFGELLRSAAAAEHNADLALLMERELLRINAGVFQGLSGRGNGERHNPRDIFALMGVYPLQLIKVLDLTGNLHRKIRSVKAGDLADSALTGEDSLTKSSVSNGIGADHTLKKQCFQWHWG